MTAQDKFDGLMRDHFAPWLKERGFRRRDATFRRSVDDNWQIINRQRSRYSDAGHVSFTVNLGVALAVLQDDAPSWAARGWPLEYVCDFPVRSVAKDVIGTLERVGLPWLDLHSDGPGLLSHAFSDLSAVSALNLGSLVSLADAIGTPEQLRAAERELASWQAGGR